ncbi:unnamed protein product [Cuscuta epithymum]|uniref:Receptor-like serine/threonine-protein kinase n=2 Tax=Cuscuta epithymum TaxID=186058 RepID=A0AAV0CNA4_9ASTE|nr:unnamed protein product [Cuscuta epithymum]
MGRQDLAFKNNITLLLSLLFISFHQCCSSTTDTITVNEILKDGDLLISNANSYALGFFTPGKSTGKRYVGIWYRKIPQRLVVWVANRNSPVNGKSGALFIDGSGNLVIQDTKTNISVWNTSLSFPATTAPSSRVHSARIQETGNLVLSRVDQTAAWQSFDYPTNTILAHMRLGLVNRRGFNLSITSWKSADDPAVGDFTVSVQNKGKPQAFLFKDSTPVWRLGPWNGIRWSGVPEMTPNITPYIFTENDDQVTEEYSIKDPDMYTIVMLNESGTLNKIIWKGENGDGNKKWVGNWYYPNDDCDGYGHCGAFGICSPYNQVSGFECRCVLGFEPKMAAEWIRRDGRHGCQRSDVGDVLCHHGEGFFKLENVKIPDTEMALLDKSIGLEECEDLCLKNCSCSGYARANISDGGMGCITWYGELIDMREFPKGGQDMYIRVSSSHLAQYGKKDKGHHRKWVIIIVVVPLIGAFILALLWVRMKKTKANKPLNSESIRSYEEGSAMGKLRDQAGQPPSDVLIFDLNTIQTATNTFAAENKIGEGGFGSVYKGTLKNGELIAVKRLTKTSSQGIEEFRNEVILIARLQHRNLVRLLGYCLQQGEKMLVYEYLPHKGLDGFIFGDRHYIHLDWGMRFKIISGVAQGLLYLHHDSRLRIIHRDLKASNVLLDASMHPKISDFGMARIFEEEQVEANTNRVVGTYGYMSPEYAMVGQFSIKSDVFSFGVLLLEIVSGKKNKYKFKDDSVNLIGDVWDFWNEDRALDIVDPQLNRLFDGREVLRCIHVGLLCVQPYPDDRPNMSDVVFMLSNETKLPPPNRPGFDLNTNQNFDLCSSTMSGGNQSIGSVSITAIQGR